MDTTARRLWPPALAAALLALLLAGMAAGRQHALEALSPVDLAFYHQSAWSALHGRGFAQTALSFEGQDLFGCVHLSLIRVLFVPLVPLGVRGLVAAQALAVGSAALAAACLARGAGSRTPGAVLAAVLGGLHPLTVTLAVTDLRPLVFLAPAALWTAVAVQRGRAGCTLLAGAVALCAREEAAAVLAALLPFAARRDRVREAAALALLAGGGAIFLLVVWGQFGTIPTHPDPGGALAAVLSGGRPLFPNPAEARFLAFGLLAALPGLLAPRLLVPGLLGWLALVVLSSREPIDAAGAGVHYLAVVHPLVVGALAVGLGAADPRVRSPRLRIALAMLLVAGTVGSTAPTLARGARWIWAFVAPSRDLVARRSLLDEPLACAGEVLTEPWAAPTLAGRAGLWVRGERAADAEAVAAIAARVGWAVLDRDGPDTDAGVAAERAQWRAALADGGLTVRRTAAGADLWGRP